MKTRNIYQVSQTELKTKKIEETMDLYKRGQFKNKQDALDLFEELKKEKPTKNRFTYTLIEEIVEEFDENTEEWEFIYSDVLDSHIYSGEIEDEEEKF